MCVCPSHAGIVSKRLNVGSHLYNVGRIAADLALLWTLRLAELSPYNKVWTRGLSFPESLIGSPLPRVKVED